MNSEVTQATLKAYAKLSERSAQDEMGLILIETQHPIEEALKVGLKAEAIFALPGKSFAFPTTPLDPKGMTKLATTDSVPPCIGVFQKPSAKFPDLLRSQNPLVLILDGLQDAGNVGTLLRSAVAFGATGVVLTGDSVNPFHPKVIRSSAGLLFHLPILVMQSSLEKALSQLPELTIMLTSNRGSHLLDYHQANYTQPTALILGREGSGIPDTIIENKAYQTVQIPLLSEVDSLNVAVSGSIILAEACRQRRAAHLC